MIGAVAAAAFFAGADPASSAAVTGPAVVTALAELKAMHASGALDGDEFKAAKRKLLGL